MKRNKKKWLWLLAIFMLILLPGVTAQAAEGTKVTMVNERKLGYPYRWGLYGTHYYSAVTEEGKTIAYCMEPDKEQVLSGDYMASPAQGNDNLRAALYYGYGGPGQSEYVDKRGYENVVEYPIKDAKYVLTHLAVSYFLNPENAFHSMSDNNIQNSGIMEFIDWLSGREIPAVASSFSKAELAASYDGKLNLQCTESVQYISNSAQNQITIACPEGITLHNESTGKAESGNVTVKANEQFYFTAPLNIVDSVGQVWESGPLKGQEDQRWEAMVIPSQGGRQISGYGAYSRENVVPAQFKVNWTSPGNLEIQKQDKDTGEKKPQGHASFLGAVYLVSRGNEEYGKIETDENGYGKMENILAGVYTVKEIKAPLGYELDSTVYTVEFKGKGETVSVLSKENAAKAKITVQKIDAETGEKVPQGQGSLKGAEYTVYAGENIGTLQKDMEVGKIITDESGQGTLENLLPGKYYVKETKAAPYYFLDKTHYEVIFPVDGTKKEEVILSREKPVKGNIEIEKIDKYTKKSVGAGFQFAVTAREDIKSDDGVVRIKKGELAEVITTGENGTAKTKALYPGIYVVKEEIPGEFYAAEEKSCEISLKAEESQKNEKVTMCIENKKTKIEIQKMDEEDKEKKLKNAEFCLYSANELTPEQIECLGEMIPEGGRKLVTDKEGICRAEDLLHNMKYYLVEAEAPQGYVRDTAVHEFYVDEKGLIEQKPEYRLELTNKPIKIEISKKGEDGNEELPGAEMALCKEDGTEVETWVTTASPHQITCLKKGTYRLKELKAPKGYKKAEDLLIEVKESSEIQKFEMTDLFLKGKITIAKKDSESKENLGQGFQFLVTAAEDIVLPYGKILYKKGDEIESICTDEKGIAKSSELFPGIYEIRETQSGEYYAVNDRKYKVELKITKNNEVKSKEIEIENTKTSFEIQKTDAKNGRPLEGVVFAISCAENQGENIEMEREQIEEEGVKITTDKDGKARLSDLKHENTYYLTETAAKDGYVKEEKIYSFKVDKQGLIDGEKEYSLNIANQQKEKTKEAVPQKKDEKSDTVKTEDENTLAGWLILCGWSAGCLAVLARKRKR